MIIFLKYLLGTLKNAIWHHELKLEMGNDVNSFTYKIFII